MLFARSGDRIEHKGSEFRAYAVAQLVEALRYKSEGGGFDPR